MLDIAGHQTDRLISLRNSCFWNALVQAGRSHFGIWSLESLESLEVSAVPAWGSILCYAHLQRGLVSVGSCRWQDVLMCRMVHTVVTSPNRFISWCFLMFLSAKVMVAHPVPGTEGFASSAFKFHSFSKLGSVSFFTCKILGRTSPGVESSPRPLCGERPGDKAVETVLGHQSLASVESVGFSQTLHQEMDMGLQSAIDAGKLWDTKNSSSRCPQQVIFQQVNLRWYVFVVLMFFYNIIEWMFDADTHSCIIYTETRFWSRLKTISLPISLNFTRGTGWSSTKRKKQMYQPQPWVRYTFWIIRHKQDPQENFSFQVNSNICIKFFEVFQ